MLLKSQASLSASDKLNNAIQVSKYSSVFIVNNSRAVIELFGFRMETTVFTYLAFLHVYHASNCIKNMN